MLTRWPLRAWHPLVIRPMQGPTQILRLSKVDSLQQRNILDQRTRIFEETADVDNVHIHQVPFPEIDDLNVLQNREMFE